MEGRQGRRTSTVSTSSRKSVHSFGGDSRDQFLLNKDWIEMQQHTFTNWINSKLRGTDYHVEDIHEDLADGVVLIKLLEILSGGKKLGRYNEAPNTDARMRDNIDVALGFMQNEENIALVNIRSNDIHQGNVKLILGVLWSLINRYQISDGKKQGNARKLLLGWVNACLPEKNIKNFGTDWNDGRNLAALVDYCKPGLIPNHATLDPYYREKNIATSMEIAEKELDVPQVLLTEDLAVDAPEELSVMTYISGFCGPNSAGQRSLLEWINKQIPNSPATNFTTDWTDGHKLGALVNAVSGGRFALANKMSSYESLEICTEAMDTAQNYLGIEKTVLPEDFLKDDLSQLSRVTYLAQFQHAKAIAVSNCIVSNLPGRKLRASRTYSIKVDTTSSNATGELIASGRGPVKGCNVQEIGDGVYLIKFTPVGVGTICVEATHGKFAIPGSPFEFKVYDPRKVKVNRAAIENGSYQVKQPIDFRVSVQQAGEGTLSGTVRGPNGEEDIEVRVQGEKAYLAHFIPTHVGRYAIALKFDGDDIADVPIRINVKAEGDTSITSGTPVRSNTISSVHSPDTTDGPSADGRQHFYDEEVESSAVSLSVNVENAGNGEGKLEATCLGREAGSIPAEVIEEEPKKFTISFVPPKSDVYTINIQMNFEYVPNDHYELENCDVVHVVEEDKAALKETIPFEQPAKFRIAVNNTGQGTLYIVSNGPGKADVTVFNNNDGTYTCKLIPSVAGKYHIDTLWEDQSASFLIMSPKKSRRVSTAYDLRNEHFEVGAPKKFKLDCEEVGNGILEILSEPRSCTKIRVTPVSKSNNYHCELLPVEPGDHKIMILYNGKHILGSPFRVRFEQARKRSSKQPISSGSPTSDKKSVEVCNLVSVNGSNAQLTSITSTAAPTPMTVMQIIEDESTNDADGPQYHLMVTAKEQRIQGSPLEIEFGTPTTDASKCKATGNGLSDIQVNQEAKFVVETRNAGHGRLSVSINGDGEAVVAKISALNDTQQEVQYLPRKPGKYTITVSWDGNDIPNSPFTVTCPQPVAEQKQEEPPEATTAEQEPEEPPEADATADSEQTQNEMVEQEPASTLPELEPITEENSQTGTPVIEKKRSDEPAVFTAEAEITPTAGENEASANIEVSYTSDSNANQGDDSVLSDYFGSDFFNR